MVSLHIVQYMGIISPIELDGIPGRNHRVGGVFRSFPFHSIVTLSHFFVCVRVLMSRIVMNMLRVNCLFGFGIQSCSIKYHT